MPTPVACLLNRPEITFILAANGCIGSRHLLSSISLPEPLAHQLLGLMPLPMKSAAKRRGRLFAAALAVAAPVAAGTAPQTGIDSNQGKAMATPTPLRTARRETCCDFEVMRHSVAFDYPQIAQI